MRRVRPVGTWARITRAIGTAAELVAVATFVSFVAVSLAAGVYVREELRVPANRYRGPVKLRCERVPAVVSGLASDGIAERRPSREHARDAVREPVGLHDSVAPVAEELRDAGHCHGARIDRPGRTLLGQRLTTHFATPAGGRDLPPQRFLIR